MKQRAEKVIDVLGGFRSWVPFLLAMSITWLLISTLVGLKLVIVWAVVCLILLGVWHWPKGREQSTERVKEGPEGALPVSSVKSPKKPLFYYGTLLFTAIEATEFGARIASYLYIRSSFSAWPPGDMPMPGLPLSTLAIMLLLASLIPTYLGDHAIKKGDQRGLQINLIIETILDLGFITLIVLLLMVPLIAFPLRRRLDFPVDKDSVTWVAPGAWGGVETPMAYADGTIYALTTNLPSPYNATAHDADTPEQALNRSEGGTSNKDGNAEIDALDAATGEILWTHEFDRVAFAGVTVVNDLVFTATLDGMVYAPPATIAK